MTQDKFEQAIDIKNQIDRLLDIDTVLVKASAGRHLLAAVDVDDSSKVTILDKTAITEELLHAFRQTLTLKVLELDKAFKAL